ncbi:MAG TPA: hypothetical protein VHE81_01235 [Lacipirellulaceae bacterium]|nr:hypothetical protein [Lacipirellulaceae bacterium]
MLSELRGKLAGLFASQSTRKAWGHKCPPVERLEDRSMLSASMGPMPLEYEAVGVQLFQSASYVPPSPQNVVGYEYESIRGSDVMEPLVDSGHAQLKRDALTGPPRMDASSYDPRGTANTGWGFLVSGPPPQTLRSMMRAEEFHEMAETQVAVSSQAAIEALTSSFPYTSFSLIVTFEPAIIYTASPSGGLVSSQNPGGDVSLGLKAGGNATTSPSPYPKKDSDDVGTYVNEQRPTSPPGNGTLAEKAAVFQVTSRGSSSASALSAAAHDVALQSFLPQTSVSTVAGPYDESSLEQFGNNAATSGATDGLISSSGDSAYDNAVVIGDAVARERDAVNSVLQDLREVAVPSTSDKAAGASGADQSDSRDVVADQLDVPVDIAGDELPAGEVDGGMVVLQSTGDVNANELDLTTMYADQLDKMIVPVGMETSVGVYEAMDVAADDTPITEQHESIGTVTETPREILVNEKLPSHDKQSSNKAAAIIGATTLTGALVWLNRNRDRQREDASSVEERRRRR